MEGVLDEYARLSRAKEALEAEIGALVAELTTGDPPAGVSGPLVDAEGFPRADIDVYRVRHQRHALVCKQNDHRAVMAHIERILPDVFQAKMAGQKGEQKVEKPAAPPAAAPVAVKEAAPALAGIDAEERTKQPFAVVEGVQDESPAATADLRAADQVLVFGTADATNHRELAAIREIVGRNIGSAIRVVVRRRGKDASGWEFRELLLTPQQWRGPGVLGCLLMPFVDASP